MDGLVFLAETPTLRIYRDKEYNFYLVDVETKSKVTIPSKSAKAVIKHMLDHLFFYR